MGFLLHVCVDSWVNEVVVGAMVAQLVVFIFFRARFHVSFSLTSLWFQAFQRMDRSLTEVVIWAFGVRWSAISLTKVSGQITFALNCLQVATPLIWACFADAWPFSLQTSQIEPLVFAWVAKRSSVERLFLFFSECMALIASSDAGISCRIRSFLLSAIIHATAWSKRGTSRYEVVIAWCRLSHATHRLHHDISVVHLAARQRYARIPIVGLRNVYLVLQSWNVSRVKVLLDGGTRNCPNSCIRMVERAIIQIVGVVMLPYRLQLESVRLLAVAKVWLLHHHRRSASKKLVLHLHVAKVGLRILVYLNSSFRPHLQVIIDLMLSQRLIDLGSLFIYFAIVDVLMI